MFARWIEKGTSNNGIFFSLHTIHTSKENAGSHGTAKAKQEKATKRRAKICEFKAVMIYFVLELGRGRAPHEHWR
jgi:hypothetical protein